jgi:heptosyltransferase I
LPRTADSEQVDAGMKRILIIRLSAIGDVVFASPLLSALQTRFPDAQIDWLAEETVAPLVQYHPHLGEVIIWPRAAWRQHWKAWRLLTLARAMLELRGRLRANQYDLVIDAQGLLKSAFLAWLSAAPRRVSFRSKEPTRWFLTERIEKDVSPVISSEYRAMAGFLGCDTQYFKPAITLPDDALSWSADFHGGQPYVVFAPFTTRPQKHWPERHWQALARAVSDEGWRVVVLGAPADVSAAERMFAGIPVVSMVGASSLLESAALVASAALMIGVDTGLTHMGWAFNVPTVAIFGSTCPYRELGELRGEVLYLDMACSPCRRRPTCGGAYECLVDLLPDQVLAAAKRQRHTSSGSERVIASSITERETD